MTIRTKEVLQVGGPSWVMFRRRGPVRLVYIFDEATKQLTIESYLDQKAGVRSRHGFAWDGALDEVGQKAENDK